MPIEVILRIGIGWDPQTHRKILQIQILIVEIKEPDAFGVLPDQRFSLEKGKEAKLNVGHLAAGKEVFLLLGERRGGVSRRRMKNDPLHVSLRNRCRGICLPRTPKGDR